MTTGISDVAAARGFFGSSALVEVAPISFFINFEPCTHLSTGEALLFPKTTVCHGLCECSALGG